MPSTRAGGASLDSEEGNVDDDLQSRIDRAVAEAIARTLPGILTNQLASLSSGGQGESAASNDPMVESGNQEEENEEIGEDTPTRATAGSRVVPVDSPQEPGGLVQPQEGNEDNGTEIVTERQTTTPPVESAVDSGRVCQATTTPVESVVIG